MMKKNVHSHVLLQPSAYRLDHNGFEVKAVAAVGKGFGTGLTFGLAGSHVTDGYEMTVRLTQGTTVTERAYSHAILSTIGNASGPHGLTPVSLGEWRAFSEAAPPETNIVAVRIKTTTGETKLFRDGDYPVLRGTAVILDERNAYLWTTGFVPRLDTYSGPETPNPLLITILRSSGEPPNIKTVLADIMGLTKINYNACNYSDGLPVTVCFAGYPALFLN
jgi:hypothetical protein